ncbi:hypothetical protein BDN72DRAFT_830734 [Pluteus cervinus]|uniref:Uncharacterized protein n=1 Tax=Pluteus cervinus TaxID=181527 RepID=A0ACD3BF06_9AGAR|nr:hypothetical protein BDN72DRAFT_830734 [Pluteus cervinus]
MTSNPTDPRLATVDDVAIILGLKQGTTPFTSTKVMISEVDRLRVMVQDCLPPLSAIPAPDLCIFLAEFSAKYLSASVDAYINRCLLPVPNPSAMVQSELFNGYFLMISASSDSPYFGKYFGSHHPSAANGKKLATVVARRLLRFTMHIDKGAAKSSNSNFWLDKEAPEAIMKALRVMAMILSALPEDEGRLSPQMKNALAPYIRRWSKPRQDPSLREICRQLSQLLNPSSVPQRRGVRNLLRGWDGCGLPGCNEKANLKICARCRTVCYCCPEHQKAHWTGPSPHKKLCFETIY